MRGNSSEPEIKTQNITNKQAESQRSDDASELKLMIRDRAGSQHECQAHVGTRVFSFREKMMAACREDRHPIGICFPDC